MTAAIFVSLIVYVGMRDTRHHSQIQDVAVPGSFRPGFCPLSARFSPGFCLLAAPCRPAHARADPAMARTLLVRTALLARGSGIIHRQRLAGRFEVTDLTHDADCRPGVEQGLVDDERIEARLKVHERDKSFGTMGKRHGHRMIEACGQIAMNAGRT